MTRVLLAPVVDQHLLGAGHLVARGGQAGEASADDAAVASRIPTGVAKRRRRAADRGVKRVEHVDIRSSRRETRIERKPEHPAIPVVVHVRPQIGEEVGRAVVEVAEDLDLAALLRDEDAPVGGELDRRWIGQP
jgi:hypothetical protein